MKEGLYTMNEVKRISIIQSVIDKKRTQVEAAEALKISDRQVRNIIKRFKEEGVDGIKHKNKFNKPGHTFTDEFKEKIIKLKLSEDYNNTNFSHFKDLLEERENIKISYSALYNMLTKENITSKKKHRSKKTHRRRQRKEARGLLIQTDGTPHDWFNIGVKYSLHGYIDDATSEILGLYMCENECLMGYLEITRQMLTQHGSPVALYSDKYSVFFPTCTQKTTIEEELEGKEKPTTQFKRIMDTLGITMIAASNSQAIMCSEILC
ncbi:MAG: ISNCY family transposase [Bacilli bacterium]|nr:ISNCY family transposase [Bacilli bacterium]